ncbi:helix-turn-helix domain-containing protein [Chromobacterium haemolyticum]|nr:helix-turn-helix domain-containing protein [Chromobacterium haemolyticum]
MDHSIAILQLLVNASYPLTQSEISEQTGIPPASCYRILGSLLETQMVSLDPGRKRAYCIGSKIFQMASAIYSRFKASSRSSIPSRKSSRTRFTKPCCSACRWAIKSWCWAA